MKRVLLALAVLATTLVVTTGPAAGLTTVVIDGVKVALQTDGDLSVTGTSGDDRVDLVSNETDSTMTDVFVGETLAMTAALKDVTISLGAGDDVAIVRANDATVSLTEDGSSTSTPNDPNDVIIGGRLSIKLGGGNDYSAVLGVDVAGNASVAFGAADLGPFDGRRDNDGGTFVQLETPGNLSITGLANVQFVTTIALSVGGQTTVDLGQGDNAMTEIASVYDRYAWNSGGGDDNVFGVNTDFGDAPSFRTAGGDDRLNLFSTSHTGKAVINTGAGNDDIFRLNGHFFANMGDGDDTLNVGSNATPNSVADGGPGENDRISGQGGPANVVIKNFEIIT